MEIEILVMLHSVGFRTTLLRTSYSEALVTRCHTRATQKRLRLLWLLQSTFSWYRCYAYIMH